MKKTMQLKTIAHCIALIGVTSLATHSATSLAQEVVAEKPQKVLITGSSIKRIASEGALPIQIITNEELSKSGINSAEELMATITANGNGADGMTSSNNTFGADADRLAGGAAFASLRGLGPGGTLVLLNGRRVSTNGMNGRAVDLNSIPMAAVERIEVLKDGASAIYGTDAIGGVINFILKTNYSGLSGSFNANATQAGGGLTKRVSLVGGFGDLEKDRFNVMASVSVDKNNKLTSQQRSSFANGYQPERGLAPDTTGTPFANQTGGTGTALGTSFSRPAYAGDVTKYTQANLLHLTNSCGSVDGMSPYQTAMLNLASAASSTYSCAYDYGADYVIQQPVERANLVSRATFNINDKHRAFLEGTASKVDSIASFTPLQIQTSLTNKNVYPVGGPYYQNLQQYISTFDPTKPIAYKWRADPFGDRTQGTIQNNSRILLAFEGEVGTWDYRVGASTAKAKSTTSLLDGYAYNNLLYPALATGKINPWLASGQSQTEEAKVLIESTKARVALRTGSTSLRQIDGAISGEIFKLPAGMVAMAAGFDLRRETYEFTQLVDLVANPILLAPGNNNLREASRDIKAIYAELSIPVLKSLEVQLAVRRDDYSDIGVTTNPKVSFRFQPDQTILFRGSANTGFLAPSFTQLYSGQLEQQLSGGRDDPIACPSHVGDPLYCNVKFDYVSGGNLNLKPETSKQASLGMVVAPTKNFSFYADVWQVNIDDRILNRTPQNVLDNYLSLPENFVRNADGSIDYIIAGQINAAGNQTRGLDVGARLEGQIEGYKWIAKIDGTHMNSFKTREFDAKPYVEQVGKFSTRDIYLRWKHNASITLAKDDWSATLTQSFGSKYKDEVPRGVVPAGFNPDVDSNTTYALAFGYNGFKDASIYFGIQNLLNTLPPFTAHNVDSVVGAGWDPRTSNPRLRSFTLSMNYKFY